MGQPVSAATAVHSVRHWDGSNRLVTEGVRRQAWQNVSCTPACPNAGPFTIYGPTGADAEKYHCAACGLLMTTQVTAPSKLR